MGVAVLGMAERPALQESEYRQCLLDARGTAYRLAFHVLGSPEAAEDAVQDSYLEAMGKFGPGHSATETRTWFLTTIVNRAKNLARSEGRRRRREAAVGEKRPWTASGRAADGELAGALRAALAGLDARYRLPLALCYQEEMSQREAAAVLQMPESTVSKHVQVGLERLRKALTRAGYAVLPVAVLAGLKTTAPAVPASLVASVEKLVAGQAVAQAGRGAALRGSGAAAAAKGGIAMKAIAGVLAAGVLAGAVAVSTGAFQKGGGPLASPGAGGNGKLAPVNPYNGMQDREEIYEFTQKPSVAKQGGKWVITFASKGRCDATVAIVDRDGKIIRHLASGVLGANAPHPFQQNTLSQKLEWDGLTDDFKKAPAGCKVKVSLGLKPEFDRNIVWDPHDLCELGRDKQWFVATGPDGVCYVGAVMASAGCVGRAYNKDGKYLYTFFPPKAADAEKVMTPMKHSFTTTAWGDKVLCTPAASGWGGSRPGSPVPKVHPGKLQPLDRYCDLVAAIKTQPGAGEVKLVAAASVGLPAPKKTLGFARGHVTPHSRELFPWTCPRMAADRGRDELYVKGGRSVVRLDGKTGEIDKSWFPGGGLDGVGELDVGPDGLVYVRTGPFGYGHWLFRMDRSGKPVPFKHNAESIDAAVAASQAAKAAWTKEKGTWKGECGRVGGPPSAFAGKGLTAIYTGVAEAHSNVHEKGLDVAYNGNIVSVVQPIPEQTKSAEFMKKHGLTYPDGKLYPFQPRRFYIVVWDSDGKVLTANAVRNTAPYSHGVHMDRDGNIYTKQKELLPAAGKGAQDGLPGIKGREAMGTLVKFRGRGGQYPIGMMPGLGAYNTPPIPNLPPPTFAESVELADHRGKTGKALGALWAYGGIHDTIGTGPSCNCHHLRHDQDGWARTWIPNQRLFSVMVLDANGNRIMRVGRYGNVEDADEKCAKIHMSWPRVTAVSDEALYVMDFGDLRIIRCSLGYAAEEELPLP